MNVNVYESDTPYDSDLSYDGIGWGDIPVCNVTRHTRLCFAIQNSQVATTNGAMVSASHSVYRFSTRPEVFDGERYERGVLNNPEFEETFTIGEIDHGDALTIKLNRAQAAALEAQIKDHDGVFGFTAATADTAEPAASVDFVLALTSSTGEVTETSITRHYLIEAITVATHEIIIKLKTRQPWWFNDKINDWRGWGLVRQVPLEHSGGTYLSFVGNALCDGYQSSVKAIYRNSRLVNPSEYTLGTSSLGGSTWWQLVTFAREQKDYSGSLYTLTADIQFKTGDPVAMLLTLPLRTWPEDDYIVIAPGYTPAPSVRVRAPFFTLSPCLGLPQPSLTLLPKISGETKGGMIGEVLHSARASMIVSDEVASATPPHYSGQRFRVVDEAWADSGLTLDSTAHGVEVLSVTHVSIEHKVKVSYSDFRELEYTIEATDVRGDDAKEREVRAPYVNDHGDANRLLAHWRTRSSQPRELVVKLFAKVPRAGQVITLDGWQGFVKKMTLDEDGFVTVTLVPAIGDAGTINVAAPADAVYSYQPDYSQTPPAAPTGLANVTFGGHDGNSYHAKFKATPPAVNFDHMMFWWRDDSTGTTGYQRGVKDGAEYTCHFFGMLYDHNYTISAYAVNAHDVEGAVATMPFAASIGSPPPPPSP